MKALPDVKSSDVTENDADAEGATLGERDTVQVAFDRGRPVIESIGFYSSQSDTEAADVKQEFGHHHPESPEDDEEEENCKRHKSKKKHKKHHHHHHKHDSGGIRKKHKKHKKRVEPIFLWAQNRESKIVRVVCEDYDPHNRLRLVKTGGVWTSNPRSRVQLTVAKSRSSSRYGDDSQKDTDEESTDDGPGCEQPDDGDDRDSKAVAKKQLDDDDEQVQYVDLNDNSIDLAETVCSEEDEDEHQARIDRALEMIERDPTLVTTESDVKAPPLDTIETAGLKLPEGTTIHQVKTEQHATFNDRPVLLASPPLPVPLSPPVSAAALQQKCTFGELTIISQKDLEDQRLQLQNEPLNLETACKRPALEIRLQEPSPVKKRRVDRPPQQQRSQPQLHKHQSLKQQPPPPPPPKSLPIGVKREWDPLSELKEVLSDPRLTVPDPLLVPKARLAALVASPATEIPKLLQQRPPSLLPPPDPDLLTVSLSHLQSILLQHADEQRGNGKAVDGSHLHQSSSNIDQMLWLSYLSTCKDMAGTDADLLSSMLNLLLPPAQNAPAAGQPPYGSYHTTQQQSQWNDFYYAASNLVVPAYGGGGGPTAAGFSKSDDFCTSPSLPPQQQKQQAQSSQKQHHQQKTHLPPAAAKQRGVCAELQCCNGASSLPPLQPSTCYEMCCAKAGVCNPFVMQLSPAGCGGGGGTGAGNLKAATVYTASDGVAAAPATCCFPAEMGCAYGCHQPPPPSPLPSPVSRKHHAPPQASPGSRNRGTPYGYQTGLGPQHQLLQQQLQTLPSTDYGNVDGAGDAQKPCGLDVTKRPQTPPPPQPPPPAPATPSSQSAEGGGGGGGDAVAAKPPPLQKAKIKVKQHLIDPNAKPKLLNIEGQLHLAGAHDLLSSPLWHPLFGSQEKRYGCRWQWTTPVTTSESTTSSDTSGTH